MNNSRSTSAFITARVDHIPIYYTEPVSAPDVRRLVIWLPGFTGTKESMQPYLEEFAANGFVALSFDPWQHGERGAEDPAEMGRRAFSNFRRHAWPILGQTALDTLRVIDWAVENLNVTETIYMGGISMGGDISAAAAGADKRIQIVAAIVATPDWLRPGMRDFIDPAVLAPPGDADAYAQYFYDHLNPLTHLQAYAHCPAITLECGAVDMHVPPDGALRFQEALKDTYQAHPDRLRVNLHPDTGHSFNPAMWHNCLEWFKRH